MNHAFIDRYANLDSPIHGLSTALKLKITLIALPVLLILIPILDSGYSKIGYGIYGLIALLIAAFSRVPWSFLLSRTALVLPFSALIVMVNYFSGSFSFSQTLETLFKSLLSVFTLLVLSSTTPFHALLKQLSQWGAPKLIIIILSFMYRYFFLLVGEIEALERAVHMRQSSVSGWKKIRIYANMVGMLLVRSYERAEHVYHAMQMRGFSGDLS